MTSTVTDQPLPLDESTVLRRLRSPAIEYVEIDGETVIYHCAQGRLHVLNPIGTLVWRLLDGVATIRQVSDDLAEQFGRPLPAVVEDVRAFGRGLEEMGVVERVS